MKNLLNFGQPPNPVAKPLAFQGASPAANPFMAKSAPAMDARGQFQAQLQNGQIKSNLEKPALPHFASKSWMA